MAKTQMKLFLLLVCLLLTGCDDTTQLQQQVQQQNSQITQLQQQLATARSSNAQAEMDASVYRACNTIGALSIICPTDVVDAGRTAMRDGFPGVGWEYWITLLGVAVTLAGTAAFMILTIMYGGIWFISPKMKQVETSRETIKTADQQATAANARAHAAASRLKQIENQIEPLAAKIEKMTNERDNLQIKIEQMRMDAAALKGFN